MATDSYDVLVESALVNADAFVGAVYENVLADRYNVNGAQALADAI